MDSPKLTIATVQMIGFILDHIIIVNVVFNLNVEMEVGITVQGSI